MKDSKAANISSRRSAGKPEVFFALLILFRQFWHSFCRADHAAIEELDEAVLNRLISKILVGEVKKIDGQKVQEVRIVYNFVGEISEMTA